jgi:DNA ligase-1
MSFLGLTGLLDSLEKTASRLLMTEMIADFLKGIDASEVDRVVYLLLGKLGSQYERIDFGLADKMVMRSVAAVLEKPVDAIQAEYKRVGDLGQVIYDFSDKDVNSEVGVVEVYEQLLKIAQAGGKGSQEQKIDLLAGLLSEMGAMERKYVIRMVLGKMRLGFSDKTILDALAVLDGGSKQGRGRLDWAYQVFPDIGLISRLVLSHGVKELADRIEIRVGVPIMPQLAQRLKTADEMIAKMGKVVVEPKFDGQRIQIHFDKQKQILKTYTRSLEENSTMFPELLEAVKQIKAESIILDCEAVGYDPETGKMRSFQETITRKRKHDVARASEAVPIVFNCFDLLYLDGESLLKKPLFERRQLLKSVISRGEALALDDYKVTSDPVELREYHKQQLGMGLEGAMVKQYDGEYQPGRTGWNWVKFKEVEEARGKLLDTIDGVVMGYYRGKGKRSAFGIGAFLLGIVGEDGEHLVSVAKIGTGLSDEQWREIRQRADMNFAMEQPARYVVAKGLIPDVWVEPRIVVEIAADEITNSPLHSSGYSLRFPRLVKFRDDKTVDQATNLSELLGIR